MRLVRGVYSEVGEGRLTLEVEEELCEGRYPDQVVQDSTAVGVVGAVVVGGCTSEGAVFIY